MRITVTRSGGFAGAAEPVGAVDTDELPEEAARDLERLVERADFFELPDELPGEVGADLYRYEVTVSENGRSHTVAFTGDEAPSAPLRELVRRVGEA